MMKKLILLALFLSPLVASAQVGQFIPFIRWTNATGTNSTTTTLAISSIASGNCLQTSTGGAVISSGAACGTGGFPWPFTKQADNSQGTTTVMSFLGGFYSSASSTLSSFHFGTATGTSATTTNLFSTNGTFTGLRVGTGATTFTGDVFFPFGAGTIIFNSTDEATEHVKLTGTNVSDQLGIQAGSDGDIATLDVSQIATSDKTFTFPNLSGTFLLTDQSQNFILGSGTTTNATSTNLYLSNDFYISPLTSALLQTGANGKVAEYAGTTCTNQFVRVLSALGIATCATVTSSDIDSSIVPSTRTITVAGTANQITSSAGAQDLSANRTWTLSIPNPFVISLATTTQLSANGLFVGQTATSTINGAGDLLVVGSTTLQKVGMTYASSTEIQSTSDSYFATAGGRVGVGIASPQAILDVNGQAPVLARIAEGASNFITLRGTAGTAAFGDTNGIWELRGIITQADPSTLKSDMTFRINAGDSIEERMRIMSSGNVGIGESAPASKLSVSGNATIGASYDTTSAPSNGLLVEGLVGIGTTTPNQALTVLGNQGTIEIVDSSDTANKGYVTTWSGGTGTLLEYSLGRVLNTAGSNVDDSTTYGRWTMRMDGRSGNDFVKFFHTPAGSTSGAVNDELFTIDGVNSRTGVSSSTPGFGFSVSGTIGFNPTALPTQSGAGNVLCIKSDGAVVQDDSPLTACSGASSRTVKHAITPLEESLDFILGLKPVSYIYNKDFTTDQTTHLGFIAEEVSDERLIDDGKVKGLKYVEFIPKIVKAIQEMWQNHETRIEKLEKENADLKARLDKLEKQ